MTNNERADKIADILRKYYDDVPETDLIDLLADARHFCDQQDLDYAKMDRMAHHHYTVENVNRRNEVIVLPAEGEGEDEVPDMPDIGDPYAGMEDPKIVKAWIVDLDRRQARIMLRLEEMSDQIKEIEKTQTRLGCIPRVLEEKKCT